MKNQPVPLCLLLGCWVGVALSPAIAQADVAPIPNVITLNATQGEQVTRTLVLQPTAPLRNLRAIAVDAQTADGESVLPAEAIALRALPSQISQNGVVTIPLEFDLRSVPSGEFTGQVLLTYDGGRQAIPVIVRVKDPWVVPFLTLAGGVLLGMAVSAYGQQRKVEDELTITVENLCEQINLSQNDARSFWQRASDELKLAQNAQRTQNLTDTQQFLNKARLVWNHWIQHRANWKEQFQYYDLLRDRLNTYQAEFPAFLGITIISRDLDKAFREAPDFEHPKDFQKKLDILAQQLNACLNEQQKIAQLQELESSRNTSTLEQAFTMSVTAFSGVQNVVPPPTNNQTLQIDAEIVALQRRLYQLNPSDNKAFQALRQDIDKIAENLKALGAVSVPFIEKSLEEQSATPDFVPNAPSISSSLVTASPLQKWGKAIANLGQTAKGRLLLFNTASGLITFIVLAGGGFSELYLSKPAFGAQGWGDYFSLLALGFGAEVARNGLTQTAQKNEPKP